VEVAGKPGAVLFWHNGPICVNAGVAALVTCMAIVALVAQCPADGVKVYFLVPTVPVLIIAGFQVPVKLFVEVNGSVGAAAL
jgi:hypothetical protein